MVAQSPSTRVHFEMASFVEAELLHQLTQYITPYADSLGMNEQVKERDFKCSLALIQELLL
jgi:ADP-dependent glucokinase